MSAELERRVSALEASVFEIAKKCNEYFGAAIIVATPESVLPAPVAPEGEPVAWAVEWASHLHGRRLEEVYLTPQSAKLRATKIEASYEPRVVPLYLHPQQPKGGMRELREIIEEQRVASEGLRDRARQAGLQHAAHRHTGWTEALVWVLDRLSEIDRLSASSGERWECWVHQREADQLRWHGPKGVPLHLWDDPTLFQPIPGVPVEVRVLPAPPGGVE